MSSYAHTISNIRHSCHWNFSKLNRERTQFCSHCTLQKWSRATSFSFWTCSLCSDWLWSYRTLVKSYLDWIGTDPLTVWSAVSQVPTRSFDSSNIFEDWCKSMDSWLTWRMDIFLIQLSSEWRGRGWLVGSPVNHVREEGGCAQV